MSAFINIIAAWPAWVVMWLLAVGVFATLKSMTLLGSGSISRQPRRMAGYLFLWPGMNAAAFMRSEPRRTAPATSMCEGLLAGGRIALGLSLIFIGAPLALDHSDLLAGWSGMVGILLVLHCGLFDILSLAWRRAGVEAPPLMNHPLNATSLGDFWGHRWNRAFRDVAHRFVFRPLLHPLGPAGATLAAFFFSGVVHDLVISLPAGGGFGLPTLYFVLQGCGLLAERSDAGRRLGLRQGLAGRLFCAVVTLGALPLVFHPPFVREIILPMLRAVGAV